MNTADELDIFPPDDRGAYRPGEVVEWSAMWSLAKPPASLEARLFWFTQGKGTEDVGVVGTQAVPNPGARGEHVFRFTLPDEPWSFSGSLVTLSWAVELVADKRAARREFTLSPDGREVQLQAMK